MGESERGEHATVWRALVVILTGLAVVVTVAVGWVAAGAAFFATAIVSSEVGVLLGVAVVACLAVGTTGAWLAARLLRRAGPRRWGIVVGAAATAGLVVAAVLTVLRPLPGTDAGRPPEVPAGSRYWTLATGSRLAYLEMPAAGRPKPTPIVVVGGGPGEADVSDAAQVRYLGQLARLGYPVYVYDQLGAGLSSRLEDPAGYTVTRHVADLEAIRQTLRADRLVLMGSSWGGSLVASYLAHHPDHVAKAIFTSPAPIDYAQWSDVGSVSSRLPSKQREQADDLLPGSPRFALWYALGAVNPQAAHRLVPDREADAYFDTYLDLVRPATLCDPAHLPDQRETGDGLYDNVFTTRDARTTHTQAEARRLLASNHTPSLILTGGCNYVPWAATRQYTTTLPDSTLVCLPRAGHVIYLDEPAVYLNVVTAFLRDAPLPVPAWTRPTPCR
jgi:pimeloyl-ACP methyl ester carboxylesterase